MTETNAKKLEELGFKKVGIDYVGKLSSYFFNVEDKQDSENELAISIDIAQNSNKGQFFSFLDKLCGDGKISSYDSVHDSVTMVFCEGGVETVDLFLNELVQQLDSIGAICICQSCQRHDDLAFYTDWKKHLILCSTCASSVMKKYEEEKNKNGNYIKGLIFSLTGALIGSVVWIIIGALGFFASIAGLAISYCAFKGYDMAKGKYSKIGIVINIVSILLAFLFAQYAVVFIEFAKELPGLTLKDFMYSTPYLFKDPEFIKAILPNLGFGLLFAVLGSYRTIANNIRTAKNNDNFKIEKIEF